MRLPFCRRIISTADQPGGGVTKGRYSLSTDGSNGNLLWHVARHEVKLRVSRRPRGSRFLPRERIKNYEVEVEEEEEDNADEDEYDDKDEEEE
ncbi:hypothetical protein T11_10449 [Trichinella zimbabwensis]|uniref:Uncharacterized protein n=1 Tax=Trichinella zimbabwensis TaxID=268475 RepID=A0A0V1HFM6_9BILA|nr:hypothetical protein T11_10449 [Trichinella zimbabwensis]